jgi:hypothetical protein
VRLGASGDWRRHADPVLVFEHMFLYDGVREDVPEGEVLAEIMTDKVNLEFESPVAGIVETLCFPEESVVQVGTVIAVLEPPSTP